MSRTRTTVILGALAASGSVACRAEPTAAGTRTEVAGIGPDTGTLGLRAVEGVALFTLVDDEVLTDPDARRRLAIQREQPTSAAVRVARLVPGADTLLTVGRAVAFDVSPTRRLVFAGTRRSLDASGTLTWFGDLQGGRPGQIILVHSSAGVTASLQVLPPNAVSYSVRPLGGGYHAVTYVDPTKFPPD